MRTVYVVPHCHWDREWYQPHELFRWRLVQMIDELLDYMEEHPEYRCFNLDGQTIVIEDYLELRPENEGRLRALIEQGRIVIGPWLVQPDEFLPSGESHIRSFQRGIRYAERLGGCLMVGHCADQFGHIAQMPQIMSQLGLTSACLWRGVPDSVPGWSFQWEAPDGTRLPVLYLRNSYSSGWRLPDDTDELVERIKREERGRADGEPAVLMNGTDHSRMEKHVPAALAAAGGRGYDFRMATLAEYERAMFAAGIDGHVHQGELRSPDRSNVLAGVLTARMNIKQRDFQVGSFLERVAEPLELLSWLHHGPDAAPALKQVWRLMLENSPHDSICGCSIDQVHREMLPRYDRAEQLARQVARESMAHLVARVGVPGEQGLAVFRTVPFAAQVVECEVPADWECEGLRLPDGTVIRAALAPLSDPGEVRQHNETSARGALRHLDFLREGRYDDLSIQRQEWQIDGRHLTLETTVGDGLNAVDDGLVRHEVREVVRQGAADTAAVTVRREATRTLRAVLPATDTVGLQLLTQAGASPAESGHLAVTKDGIANEFYLVRFRKGRLEIIDWANGIVLKDALTFVDEGDRGDEYNADILADAVTSRHNPDPILRNSVKLLAIRRDLVSATLVVNIVMPLPIALNTRRTRRAHRAWSANLVHANVRITVWAGIPRVDFRVRVQNTAKDHRLRALFRLPFVTDQAITENQFHVAERPLTPPPWNGTSAEQPPTTFPQKTFAAFEGDGMGLAVLNRGLPEGEVVRDGKGRQSYALTLLRCVGWLSRNDLRSRRGGAGPMIATPDAQMPGIHTFQFALTTYRGGWREAHIQPMAHAFAYPPLAYPTNGHDGSLGLDLPLARFSGPEAVPSAMHRSEADGAPVIRVYNSSAEPTVTRIGVPPAAPEAGLTGLMEHHRESLEAGPEGWALGLRPWEIASVRFGRRE
ncbi:MAG: glycoside hydrolase family 38 C-terminal domain-containing protein [Dehalococcoidia bacterium]